jgi:(4S)-4-hydroxy-5-phosphonooxypentane-2,3-dione isomerase
VTAPMTVLAAGEITFMPALPPAYEQAFADLPFGLVDKIGIAFTSDVFGETPANSVVTRHEDVSPAEFGMGVAKFSGQPMMNLIVAEELAHELEAGGDGAITAYAQEFLTATFGSAAAAAIDRTIIHLWGTDPFRRASSAWKDRSTLRSFLALKNVEIRPPPVRRGEDERVMDRLVAQVSNLSLIGAFALSVGTGAQEASPATSPAASAVPPMGTEVAWLVELAVKPGALESVRVLMEEMVISAQSEPGTLSYAWYVSEDGRTVAIYERYADDAAVLSHQARFGERFAERFLGAMTVTRYTVLGAPGEEVRESLRGFTPSYLQPFGGYSVR